MTYISREAATAYASLPKHLRNYQTENLDDAWEDGYDYAISQIDAIPAADVVEVVRCADCEYFSEPGWCENPNTFAILTRGNTSPNWFCADGKRKDGGQDDV